MSKISGAEALCLFAAAAGTFIVAVLAKNSLMASTPDALYYPTTWALIWTGAAFWLAFRLQTTAAQFCYYILAGAMGGATGWLLGVYFFPLNSTEEARFQSIGTVLGTLLTGYLLKELGEVWKYLTASVNQQPPKIFCTPHRECIALFVASLLVSGGVQYGNRTFQSLSVGWSGPMPELSKDKADHDVRLIRPKDRFRLAGALHRGDNIGLRWTLQSNTAPDTLKKALETGAIRLDTETGVLESAETWTNVGTSAGKPLYADIVGSSLSDPINSGVLHVRFDPPAQTAAPAAPTPAPVTPAATQ